MTVVALSSRCSSLASFENAYAVAIQLRENTGVDQFVIRTDNPISPSVSLDAGRIIRKVFPPWLPDRRLTVVSLRSLRCP